MSAPLARGSRAGSLLAVFAASLLFLCPAGAQEQADLVVNPEVNKALNMVYAYTCTAKACGDSKEYGQLRLRLDELLALANRKGSLTADGIRLRRNRSLYIDAGARFYESSPKIPCSEYRKHVPTLLEEVDELTAINR